MKDEDGIDFEDYQTILQKNKIKTFCKFIVYKYGNMAKIDPWILYNGIRGLHRKKKG